MLSCDLEGFRDVEGDNSEPFSEAERSERSEVASCGGA